MSFYKKDTGRLLEAPTTVLGPDYQLYDNCQHDYTYPIEGWHWFDSRDVALDYFGIVEKEEVIVSP